MADFWVCSRPCQELEAREPSLETGRKRLKRRATGNATQAARDDSVARLQEPHVQAACEQGAGLWRHQQGPIGHSRLESPGERCTAGYHVTQTLQVLRVLPMPVVSQRAPVAAKTLSVEALKRDPKWESPYGVAGP